MLTRALAAHVDGLTLPAELVVPDEPRALVVLCHGIPSAAPPDPADPGYAGLARTVAARGLAAVWFNFRGSRDAPGDFSVAGWTDDLEAVLDTARARAEVAGLPLALVGSSMGGMTAIAVAARRSDVACIATLAAPASLEDALPDPLAFLHVARNRGMIRDPAFPRDPDAWAEEFRALAGERHVAAIAPRPLLIMHGDADPDVPYVHAERLFAAAGAPKELVRLPRGGHRLRHDARALDALFDWFERTALPVPS